MIEWNDGLSIGIQVLDDDHKKLLGIINRLSNSTQNTLTKDVVIDIFQDLEDYSVKHFYREEAYMKKCNYQKIDEHILQHKSFVDKIPELKEKLLASQDTSNIHEVSTYLTEWLVNHIISEDMPLIVPFEENGLTEYTKSKNSIFDKMVQKVTTEISFTKRILFSALIPLIVMITLGFIIIINNYNSYNDMKKTSNITHILKDINNLIHNIQVERGLSSGYISSKNNKFKDSLSKQHTIIDKKISLFNIKIEDINADEITIIKSNIKTFKNDIIYLNILREQVKLKEISQANAILAYTKIIDNILDITINIAFTNHDTELARYISTLSAISHFKEYLGQERAYGTMILEQQNTTIQEYITFMQLIGAQSVHLDIFEQSATQIYKDFTTDIFNSKLVAQINEYENQIKNYNCKNLDSKVWFKLTTDYIDKIKIIEDKLLEQINTLINKNIQESMQNLTLWFFIITLIIIITLIVVYLFEYSSKKELYKFTEAMKHLTDGKRSMKLPHMHIKGAMAQMYNSYEVMRQKLLEGDIYTKLFQKQKEIELKNKQIQNEKLEELAFIDPLTGCVNRRKFEELSHLELQRSLRYKSDLSFLMLDIDHFKSVNDTYGHAIGDSVLKHFSSVCLNLARNVDVVARIGGEEFIVMLPETDADGAFIFAERFREQIYKSEVIIDEQKIKYTVSIGISILNRENDTDLSIILQRADEALYEAKGSGRNKSIVYKDKNV